MGMPDNIFDRVDGETRAKAIAEARESVRAGRVVDNAIMCHWLDEAADAIEAGRPLPPLPVAGIP